MNENMLNKFIFSNKDDSTEYQEIKFNDINFAL